jgi:hypothetical protein
MKAEKPDPKESEKKSKSPDEEERPSVKGYLHVQTVKTIRFMAQSPLVHSKARITCMKSFSIFAKGLTTNFGTVARRATSTYTQHTKRR